MLWRWFLIVLSATPRWLAISLLRAPSVSSLATRPSAPVSGDEAGRGDASCRSRFSTARRSDSRSIQRPPACTFRMHCTSSPGAISLSKTPWMPSRNASSDSRSSIEAFRLGIHGVLLKEMAPGLLVQCIRKVLAGGRWVELESLRRAVENLLRDEALPRPAASPLTPAEVRVAGLLVQGARNKEIANHLGVSESTIKNHLHNTYTKLNLSSRGELARWYRTGGYPSGSSEGRSMGRFERILQPSDAA